MSILVVGLIALGAVLLPEVPAIRNARGRKGAEDGTRDGESTGEDGAKEGAHPLGAKPLKAGHEKKLVAIESPYKATPFHSVEENESFARNVCRKAVDMGLNPYAMHLFFTQFLDDNNQTHRNLGITCGLGWTDLAHEVWFCLRPDDVISTGMKLAIERNHAKFPGRTVRFIEFEQDGTILRELTEQEALERQYPAPQTA